MSASDEFQRYADECLASARNTKNDVERKAFLDMARAWRQAAAELNGIPVEAPSRDAGTGPLH